MKRLLLSIAVLSLMACDRPGEIAESEDALTLELRLFVFEWLHRDCAIDTDLYVPTLKRNSRTLVPAFWDAYQVGPALADEQTFSTNLMPAFEARSRWLEGFGREMVGEEVTHRLLSEPFDVYRDAELARYRIRWRDAALNALGYICSASALELLQNVANEERNPDAHVARLAIARCAQPGR